MDDVQNCDIYINMLSSETYIGTLFSNFSDLRNTAFADVRSLHAMEDSLQ
jgi:hypothetical protein